MVSSMGLTVIKIGGVLLTHKAVPSSVNFHAAEQYGLEFRRILAHDSAHARSTVVVLGGGSFGNFIPAKYSLSPRSSSTLPEDISRMSLGQMELARAVIDTWRAHGVACQFFHLPSLFIELPNSASASGSINPVPLRTSLACGLIPVLMGDLVMHEDGRTEIVSSDRIPMLLHAAVGVGRAVYLTDVPGVLRQTATGISTIKELKADDEELAGCNLWEASADFTGGMRLKLKCAFELANRGIPTHIIDGRDAGALGNLLVSRQVDGSTIVPAHETAA
jgi:isopentenyl phosphate kinase